MKHTIFLAFALSVFPLPFLQAQSWQQGVDYTIEVTLDDEEHVLRGTWELVYTNNSPEELNEIWMHLWPNAFESTRSAFAKQKIAQGDDEFLFADEADRGYIEGLAFKGGGQPLDYDFDPKNPDIARVVLAAPLAPGQSITLQTPFLVKLPESFSRLGHVDQQYQITQWYPKPAVYDDEGWHPIPYLDQGEFFSEFGSYEVKITLPSNYVVGATGELQEQSEIDWLLRKANVPVPDGRADDFPPSSDEMKTLTYRLDSIHDFAWFADKRYIVRHDSVVLPSGKSVGLWAMFNLKDSDVWEQATEYMADGLFHYSDLVGEYPYDMCTAVDGALSAGAGMEYPTITVLGGSEPFSLEQVIVHELGHNWFYGILGSNEREHPWMDEGMNSYYELRYFDEKYPNLMITRKQREDQENIRELLETFGIWGLDNYESYQLGYQATYNFEMHQPLNLPADHFSSINYGTSVYMKSAAALRMLQGYWGIEKFDRVMQAYYEAWKFDHPAPDDFRKILETEGGEDLSWFFEGLIESRMGLDAELRSAKLKGNEWTVKVKQVAGYPGPVSVGLMKDGEVTAVQWVNLTPEEPVGTVKFLSQGDEDAVVIDPHEWMPETNRRNNRITRQGLLKKVEPLVFVPVLSAPMPDRTVLYYSTNAGFNSFDGFMLGASLHNASLLDQRFTYLVAPYWAFGSRDIVGSYRVRIKPFQELVAGHRVMLQGQGQRYSGTQRHTASLQLDRMPLNRKNPVYSRARFAYHNLTLPGTYSDELSLMPAWGTETVLEVSGKLWQKTARFEWEDEARVWNHTDATRLENTWKGSFHLPDRGLISLRSYVGLQQTNADSINDLQYMYLDGGRDFLMEHVLFNRQGLGNAVGPYGRQTIGQEGNFKANTPIRGSAYMVAFNLEVSIPKLYGLGVFTDVAITDGYDGLVYDAGLMWKPLPNWFEVYFPLIGTDVAPADLGQNIRFMLNMAALNPYTLAEDLLK